MKTLLKSILIIISVFSCSVDKQKATIPSWLQQTQWQATYDDSSSYNFKAILHNDTIEVHSVMYSSYFDTTYIDTAFSSILVFNEDSLTYKSIPITLIDSIKLDSIPSKKYSFLKIKNTNCLILKNFHSSPSSNIYLFDKNNTVMPFDLTRYNETKLMGYYVSDTIRDKTNLEYFDYLSSYDLLDSDGNYTNIELNVLNDSLIWSIYYSNLSENNSSVFNEIYNALNNKFESAIKDTLDSYISYKPYVVEMEWNDGNVTMRRYLDSLYQPTSTWGLSINDEPLQWYLTTFLKQKKKVKIIE
jgi:hypothetical protein